MNKDWLTLNQIFSDNKRVRIFIFLLRKAQFFFQYLTLGYMTKTLNQIIFVFLHQNQNIFSASLGIKIFEVPYINYFLALIKHYFFSQFYNYNKNKSLQVKAFSKLKSWYWCSFNISIIHNQIQIDGIYNV
jgi:hypothetical protein